MTIEQIKEEAKKFSKDLNDEQAQALLEKDSELTDEVLEAVAGGALSNKDVRGTAELAYFQNARQQKRK